MAFLVSSSRRLLPGPPGPPGPGGPGSPGGPGGGDGPVGEGILVEDEMFEEVVTTLVEMDDTKV